MVRLSTGGWLVSKERPMCCGKKMMKDGETSGGKPRWKCSVCGLRSTLTNDRPGLSFEPVRDEILANAVKKGANKFIVTCAVNNSGRLKNGWQSLLNYADFLGAELAVIPVSYRNPSHSSREDYKKWWAADLKPYLITKDIYLGGGIQLIAEKPIKATAINPIQGLEPIGGKRTCIYGHPQLSMEPVAAPANKLPKRVWTTGAITEKNYSASKDGGRAHFYHVQSALLIEIENNKTFIRVLGIDRKGEFYDLDRHITPDGVTTGHRIGTLTTGDEHELFMLPSVKRGTYTDSNSIVKFLKPEIIVRHDVLDGYSISHHHDNDPITQFKKHHKKLNDCRYELDRVVKHINETTPKGSINWIVPSNHHDHLDKWLSRANANNDHQNAILITELQKAVRECLLAGKEKSAMQIYLEPRLTVPTVFLDRNTPALYKNVDHSQHFDVGVNGSRGSAAGIAKTMHKASGGHSHSARICKSVYQAGKSTGRLEYERGLSNHTNTHIAQYPNGKRTPIDLLGGQYCANDNFSLSEVA